MKNSTSTLWLIVITLLGISALGRFALAAVKAIQLGFGPQFIFGLLILGLAVIYLMNRGAYKKAHRIQGRRQKGKIIRLPNIGHDS